MANFITFIDDPFTLAGTSQQLIGPEIQPLPDLETKQEHTAVLAFSLKTGGVAVHLTMEFNGQRFLDHSFWLPHPNRPQVWQEVFPDSQLLKQGNQLLIAVEPVVSFGFQFYGSVELSDFVLTYRT